jgi:hypothetical protein
VKKSVPWGFEIACEADELASGDPNPVCAVGTSNAKACKHTTATIDSLKKGVSAGRNPFVALPVPSRTGKNPYEIRAALLEIPTVEL